MSRDFHDPDVAEIGRANLRAAVTVLEGRAVDYWIEAGTYLGCIRHAGRFIPHDFDIDIGIRGDSDMDLVITALYAAGFKAKHFFGRPGHGREASMIRNGIKLDIFSFYPEGDKLWMACWRGRRMIRLDFDAGLFDPTSVAQMEDVAVRTPNDADAYLTARYGPMWKIPNPGWRWDIDPRCINWSKSDITLEEIQTLWPRSPRQT